MMKKLSSNLRQHLFSSESNIFLHYNALSFFAVKNVEVPKMGDSITSGTLQKWNKKEGEYVLLDEIVATIETDKVKIDIRSPEVGMITKLYAKEDEVVEVGKILFDLDLDKVPQKTDSGAVKPKPSEQSPPSPQKVDSSTPKTEAPKSQAPSQNQTSAPTQPAPASKPSSAQTSPNILPSSSIDRTEKRVPMSRLRLRVAQRLKESQNTYAFLTTFNEIDMGEVMETRKELGEEFLKANGVKLGIMSFFVKAVATAIKERPIVNAIIDGNEIVYRNYVDVSVAVQGPDGLIVPVIRNADKLTFAQIEKKIIEFGNKAKDGSITIEDMTGGTFTISNGGIFGSIMSTPLINPPQTAILGMHNIVTRPVVRGDQIVARPVMYAALTYDHRLLDGREGASFLKRVCTLIDEPRRLLLTLQ